MPITNYKELIMAKETTTPTTPTTNLPSGMSEHDALMKVLGIDTNQVEVVAKSTKSMALNTNFDKMKANAKQVIQDVMSEHGTHISFICFVRKGFLKDANGDNISDEDGKPKKRYTQETKNGYWTVDKRDDGLYDVSRSIYYTESFTVSRFDKMKV
jgi:hypothetical protein